MKNSINSIVASLLFSSLLLMSCSESKPHYSVTYNGNSNTSGTAPLDSNSYEEGDNTTILGPEDLLRTGHTFTSWNTTQDGTGVDHMPGSIATMGNSDLILYAKWTSNTLLTCLVSYNGNGNTGGSPPSDPNNYEENDSVTVLGPGSLEKTGYEFDSWNTEQNGSGTSYDEDDIFQIGDEDVELFAIWNKVYSLRDAGPAGGLIFYVNPNHLTDGWRYLEAAPQTTEWSAKQWGSNGTLVDGTGTAIGEGLNNTNLIVTAIGAVETGRAAQLCNELEVTIYDDWFLPSQDELNEMFEELHLHALGGFATSGYWSSSEVDADNARRQTFNTGLQTTQTKNTTYMVRAARRF